jgi:hypothetical protein
MGIESRDAHRINLESPKMSRKLSARQEINTAGSRGETFGVFSLSSTHLWRRASYSLCERAVQERNSSGFASRVDWGVSVFGEL